MATSRRSEARQGPAALPSMTTLLDSAAGDVRFAGIPRLHVKSAIHDALASARGDIRAAESAQVSADSILTAAIALLSSRRRTLLGRVINATGIVLHTGLGRAPLAASAVEAVTAAAGYCNLEIDMESGQRGRRAAHCEEMLCRLTGAQAALVVNNNAAATLLVLAGLASGREVIVSRGQLIEIGGSFRMPDVMAASCCVMREVGTTNKTHLHDYEAAINERTALLLHVHTSNYRVEGFAEAPDVKSLVELAKRQPVRIPAPARSASEGKVHNFGNREPGTGNSALTTDRGPLTTLLVYDDLGSGALLPDNPWNASGEPTVPASLTAGADVISFSGDKLLGGPQCGLILGRRDVIETLRRHPIARAVRVDKLTIAALQTTLALYADPDRARREIPTLAMLHASLDTLQRRADSLAAQLVAVLPAESFHVQRGETFAGGGSLPTWSMPTFAVAWSLHVKKNAALLAHALRHAAPPVVPRIENDTLVFDVRTLNDDELPLVAAAVHAAFNSYTQP